VVDSSQVDDIEVRLFLEALFARYGYDLRGYAIASMRRRVHSVLGKTGFSHLGELQHQLLKDPALLATVVDGLTVQVSDMFRDPTFYRVFRAEVVPHLRPYPQIRIWHAGCAGGEEVYSIAILLMEEGLYDRAQVYATDVSPQALARAREGVYSLERARTFADNYAETGGPRSFDAYHSEAYGRIAIDDSLKKNVFFFQHNLTSDHAFGEMQVILCRNVLVYFGAGLRDRVFAKFAAGLCHGGFLTLGSAERLLSGHGKFVEFSESERIYRFWGGP
jgi:chemotaxis protein methyltransferase CheR